MITHLVGNLPFNHLIEINVYELPGNNLPGSVVIDSFGENICSTIKNNGDWSELAGKLLVIFFITIIIYLLVLLFRLIILGINRIIKKKMRRPGYARFQVGIIWHIGGE